MAIYRLSAQIIGRSTGRTATAAAAYRAGVKIKDERTGEVHDYRRRQGVYQSEIIAPKNAPLWVYHRSQLWNDIERVERRGDAQLAREIQLALPKELNHREKMQLAREYVQAIFVSRGMVADIAFHDFETHNPHAHVMLTMRHLTSEGFGNKNREWNKKYQLENWRKEWEVYANHQLQFAGHEIRIDHRSLVAQGITRIPNVYHRFPIDPQRPETQLSDYQRDEQDRRDAVNRTLEALITERAQLEAKIAQEQTWERRVGLLNMGLVMERIWDKQKSAQQQRLLTLQEHTTHTLLGQSLGSPLTWRKQHQVDDERERIARFKEKLAAKVNRERSEDANYQPYFPARQQTRFPLPAPINGHDEQAVYAQVQETVQYAHLPLEQQWRIEQIWQTYNHYQQTAPHGNHLSPAEQYRFLMGWFEAQPNVSFNHDKVVREMKAMGYREIEVWAGRREADPFLINQSPRAVLMQHHRLYEAYHNRAKKPEEQQAPEPELPRPLPDVIVWSELREYQRGVFQQIVETYDPELNGEQQIEQRYQRLWWAWKQRKRLEEQGHNLCPIQRYRLEMARQWAQEQDNPERHFQSKMSHTTVIKRMLEQGYTAQDIWQGRRYGDPFIIRVSSPQRLMAIHQEIVQAYAATHQQGGGATPPAGSPPTAPGPTPIAPNTPPSTGGGVTSPPSESSATMEDSSTFIYLNDLMGKTFKPRELTESDIEQLYEAAYSLNAMLLAARKRRDQERIKEAHETLGKVKKALWLGAGVSGEWIDALQETHAQRAHRQLQEEDLKRKELFAQWRAHRQKLDEDAQKQRRQQRKQEISTKRDKVTQNNKRNVAQTRRQTQTKTAAPTKRRAKPSQPTKAQTQSASRVSQELHTLRQQIESASASDLIRLQRRRLRKQYRSQRYTARSGDASEIAMANNQQVLKLARHQASYGMVGEVITNGYRRSPNVIQKLRRPPRGLLMGLALKGHSPSTLSGILMSQDAGLSLLGQLKSISNRQRQSIKQVMDKVSPLKGWRQMRQRWSQRRAELLREGHSRQQLQQKMREMREMRQDTQARQKQQTIARETLNTERQSRSEQSSSSSRSSAYEQRPAQERERGLQGGKDQTAQTPHPEAQQQAKQDQERTTQQQRTLDETQQRQERLQRDRDKRDRDNQQQAQEKTRKKRDAAIAKKEAEQRQEQERQRLLALQQQRDRGRDR